MTVKEQYREEFARREAGRRIYEAGQRAYKAKIVQVFKDPMAWDYKISEVREIADAARNEAMDLEHKRYFG